MNEIIFFTHILLLIFFISLSLRIGLGALIAMATIQVVLANLFVTKQIVLFSLTVTGSDAYILGSLLTANLIQEYYGKEEANKLVKITFLLFVFSAAMSLIQIIYAPAINDLMHPHFYAVLQSSPRIFLASLITFFLVQKLDIEVFGYFRKRFSFKLAMGISLTLTQAVDTILFSMLALYKVISPLLPILFLSYAIKMITLASMVPLTSFIARKVKRAV